MTPDPQSQESPKGHITLLVVFMVATIAFLYDTLNQSHRLENVIVILPVSVVVLLLCGHQIFKTVRSMAIKTDVSQTIKTNVSQRPEDAKVILSTSTRTAMFMVLLGLYVLGLIYFYFDISTFLFIALALWVQGEKRYIFGTFYALVLSILVIWGLKEMVPYPFENLFF